MKFHANFDFDNIAFNCNIVNELAGILRKITTEAHQMQLNKPGVIGKGIGNEIRLSNGQTIGNWFIQPSPTKPKTDGYPQHDYIKDIDQSLDK
jgi:hypothetical protein